MERKVFWLTFAFLGVVADFVLPLWWAMGATIAVTLAARTYNANDLSGGISNCRPRFRMSPMARFMTKLNDRTIDDIKLDEVERVAI